MPWSRRNKAYSLRLIEAFYNSRLHVVVDVDVDVGVGVVVGVDVGVDVGVGVGLIVRVAVGAAHHT